MAPIVVEHTFDRSRDGQLLHFIDGYLRATVPPEGWADYCKDYPEAQNIVDSLTVIPKASETVTEKRQRKPRPQKN